MSLSSSYFPLDHEIDHLTEIGMGGEGNVALVVGSTGITGLALVDRLKSSEVSSGPWKVYGIARKSKPEWHSPDVYIQCELEDEDETREKLASLTDVTHMFWVTWVEGTSEEETSAVNGRVFRTVLDVLLSNATNFQHVCLQTGAKQYVGSFDQWDIFNDKLQYPDSPFLEDEPRLPGRNFYYTLEDTMFEAFKRKQSSATWSVHRPGILFGFAPGNKMNLIGTCAVYGVMCKHLGRPFVFPGTLACWEGYSDASDVGLVAEQQIWACTNEQAKNQVFNSVNGDVFKWKKLWKLLGEKLGVEAVPPTDPPLCLSQMMYGKGPVWNEIVQKHSLRAYDLSQLAQFWLAEIMFTNFGGDALLSTNKSKEFGFLAFRNSEKSFLFYIEKMKKWKLIP